MSAYSIKDRLLFLCEKAGYRDADTLIEELSKRHKKDFTSRKAVIEKFLNNEIVPIELYEYIAKIFNMRLLLVAAGRGSRVDIAWNDFMSGKESIGELPSSVKNKKYEFTDPNSIRQFFEDSGFGSKKRFYTLIQVATGERELDKDSLSVLEKIMKLCGDFEIGKQVKPTQQFEDEDSDIPGPGDEGGHSLEYDIRQLQETAALLGLKQSDNGSKD